jgi:hypothetical protein
MKSCKDDIMIAQGKGESASHRPGLRIPSYLNEPGHG